MIKIKGKLISEEIFDRQFVCDLNACKGACCIQGDTGAPLEESEKAVMEAIYPKVVSYMRPEGREAVEAQGTWVIDKQGYLGTPLINDEECAYVVFKDGTAFCAIEQAHRDGKIDYPKPISCHLYPIRVLEMDLVSLEALNFDEWDICAPACKLGKQLKVPVFQFLKAPLIRKYGPEFYQEMDEVFQAYEAQKPGIE